MTKHKTGTRDQPSSRSRGITARQSDETDRRKGSRFRVQDSKICEDLCSSVAKLFFGFDRRVDFRCNIISCLAADQAQACSIRLDIGWQFLVR